MKLRPAYLLAFSLFLLLTTTAFISCYGFKLPDINNVRREFRKKVDAELEKIVEKTPDARARQKWRVARDAARNSIARAEVLNAMQFASGEFEDAREYLERAIRYSAKKEYVKAEYLGRQSKKMAELAYSKSKKILSDKEQCFAKAMKRCADRLKKLENRIPSDDDSLALVLARLKLEKGHIENMAKTGKFDEAVSACSDFEKEIVEKGKNLPSSGEKVEVEHWI